MHTLLPIGIGLLLFAAAPCRADELAEKGRTIFNQHHRTVVTVQMVIKSKASIPGMNSQTNESHQTISGTVIDPSGLAVVSLAAVDASEMMKNLPPQRDSRIKVEIEISGLRMLLEDGGEVAADVVGREKDL